MANELDEKAASILGYLKIRNWSLINIRSIRHGSDLQSININATLYITYAFAAIDFVADSFEPNERVAKDIFLDEIADALPQGFFSYSRELRNSVIHRGLDPAPGGTSDGSLLKISLPEKVTRRDGAQQWLRPVEYWDEFGSRLNTASNGTIRKTIEAFGWLSEHARPEAGGDLRDSIMSANIPLPPETIREIHRNLDEKNEYAAWAEEIIVSRRRNILEALAVS